ncbi:unnamed protein product [Lathyrus sativus]|nr:unnamed protein product [Lathyrus sativus]
MARRLKKHLKRLNAPKHWMPEQLGGAFAPKPSSKPQNRISRQKEVMVASTFKRHGPFENVINQISHNKD